MKYNKGEWSEAYAFIKLIGDGEVYACDENLNKINKVYPILKIFKDEINKYYINDDKSVVKIIDFNGEVVSKLSVNEFIKTSESSLKYIKESEGRSFEVPILEEFLKKIGITNFKANSTKKEDIKMEILDVKLNKPEILTFSIKSELGGKPTLLNASKLTNFRFRLNNISKEEVNNLNSIDKSVGRNWLKLKFNNIFEGFKNGDYEVYLVDEKNNVFYQNLRLIDSNLPMLLAYILFYFYSHERIVDIQSLTKKLTEYNPLNLDNSEKDIFYIKKISEFIESVTFGMMPNKKWNGKYEISGGLLTVKQDGDILCHHIFYDNNSLKNYLLKHTKLESPSTSRHFYGQIFEENEDFYFNLNLQVRFK